MFVCLNMYMYMYICMSVCNIIRMMACCHFVIDYFYRNDRLFNCSFFLKGLMLHITIKSVVIKHL